MRPSPETIVEIAWDVAFRAYTEPERATPHEIAFLQRIDESEGDLDDEMVRQAAQLLVRN